jgi:hypothetical protein
MLSSGNCVLENIVCCAGRIREEDTIARQTLQRRPDVWRDPSQVSRLRLEYTALADGGASRVVSDLEPHVELVLTHAIRGDIARCVFLEGQR